jgi:ribonuclease HII
MHGKNNGLMLKARFHIDADIREAGCDEAGRGCLAGPVFAAAVVLPAGFRHKLLNDSKQVAETHREELRYYIEQNAEDWAVASCTPAEIDELNILKASFEAMHRAVAALKSQPAFLLIDGNRFRPYPNIPHACIVKGDAIFRSIAAASILAKTHRDEFMTAAAVQYPRYGWKENKGYPTAAHRKAIAEFGLSPLHRKTFRQLPNQPALFDPINHSMSGKLC